MNRPRARVLQATVSTNPGAFALADWARFVSIAAIWGSSFLFIAVALDELGPGLITWGRVALGAIVLNAVPQARVRLDSDDRLRVIVLSIVWVALPFTLFPLAEQHINSAITGMLNGSVPVFAAAISVLVLRNRLGRAEVLGLVVGLAGVGLVSASQTGEGETAWFGVALVLTASACYGLAVHLAAPLQQRYGSLPLMARMLALASFWTAPFGIASVPSSSWAPGPAAAVAFIGIVGTGIAFVIMATLVGSVGSTRASMMTYLIPVVALGLGVAFRDDRVTPLAIAGVVLVVGGASLASRQESATA